MIKIIPEPIIDILSRYEPIIGKYQVKQFQPTTYEAGKILIITDSPVPRKIKNEIRQIVNAVWNINYEVKQII